LKIAWFTPFYTHSAIGQVSKLVCEELQKTCKVDIFAFEQGQTISSSVPLIKFTPSDFDIRQLNGYDHIVYNMGNYARNHKAVWEVMQRFPGVLLLHDQIMQNFFQQITMLPEFGGNSVTGEREYLKLMRNSYGEQGEAAGIALFDPYMGERKVRIWASNTAMAYPLFEPLLAKATAVFSHAAFFMEKIKQHFYGPTGYAYLPHLADPLRRIATIPAEFKNGSKALIVSTGIVHPVKRIAQVAEMLLANPGIANRVRYVVIGEHGGLYGEYLNSLAQGPLQGCLYLLGYQPQEVMEAFLRESDFCVNLRYPNSEVCSKSLIEQMAFEKPVIVLKKGVFDEIPDDCVAKIKLENEMLELANVFQHLLDHESQRHEIGRRAVDFVEQNCTPKVYASRFESFLESVAETIAMNRLVNDSVQLNRSALNDLGFTQQTAPSVVDATWRELSQACGAVPSKQPNTKVLGVWFGFPYVVSLRREGITRFMSYMLLALLERYPIDCEIWTYSFNEEEVRAGFDPLLKETGFENRVRIVTEKNFGKVLDIPSYKLDLPLNINETLDNLAWVAREYSRATCFVTAIVYLDNMIGTGKPLFVPVHDLGLHVHYDDFVSGDPLYKARHVDIRSRAENLARSGAFMFSNSEFVRREHVLKHVSSLQEEQTAVVYLPVNIPRDIHKTLLSEKEIREKFGLRKPYIFYPTQVRPYKNISVLVEALAILRDKKMEIDLVLTGRPADVPKVETAIQSHKLENQVISLSAVAENELYSLYRYAAVAAVPTLLEGGFPWQACEALFMDTPLVVSDIPVVRERIAFCGMTPEDSGLTLFNPENPLECASAMEKIILDRAKALESQMRFRDNFLAYSWHDAADWYYKLFFGE
jgi:glycosyltransferase involved in cell wall biosynthesis